MTLVVIDAVGLTPRALTHMPRVRRLAGAGFQARVDPVLPAVTCSVQSSFVTGLEPTDHGIVGNGWYFRDLGEVFLWRQHNKLVQGEKVWETARRAKPDFKVANVCWWYAMGASADLTVTPRPIYFADGKKEPDCYTWPPALHDRLTGALGEFPLFTYWGPTADITSSRWIAQASRKLLDEDELDMLLVYLPHLDYDHQRFGPDDPRSVQAVRELDVEVGRLVEAARATKAHVIVLSEYGIEQATRVVFLNRVLHEKGLLRVQETSHGQLLDCGACRAFAVADHQCAHVHVANPGDIGMVRDLLAQVPGVARVLDAAQQKEFGINHARSGELVCIAEPGCWFAYHYWLDEARRPDFAPTVDIHRKPGYDPAELFLDPKIAFPKLKIAKTLAKKLLGFRYLMDVIPTDPSMVRGTHGRLYGDDEAGPVFLCSDRALARDRVAATDVKELCLRVLSG